MSADRLKWLGLTVAAAGLFFVYLGLGVGGVTMLVDALDVGTARWWQIFSPTAFAVICLVGAWASAKTFAWGLHYMGVGR